MATFAIVDMDGRLCDERYNDLDQAVEVARKMVSDDPDTDVDVVQMVKQVVSSVQVEVKDV